MWWGGGDEGGKEEDVMELEEGRGQRRISNTLKSIYRMALAGKNLNYLVNV